MNSISKLTANNRPKMLSKYVKLSFILLCLIISFLFSIMLVILMTCNNGPAEKTKYLTFHLIKL